MISELITITIMAFALGMDAFSLAIGMGMIGLRYRQMFRIGITIGLFHILMPLLGLVIGKVLSQYFGMMAIIIGGLLLLVLGIQMVYSACKGEENNRLLKHSGFGLLLFAFSVSVDSFSVGLSLGMVGAKTLLTVLSFGMMSMLLSWLGLLIGKKVQGYIGTYGELLGGGILIAFGLKLLLPI